MASLSRYRDKDATIRETSNESQNVASRVTNFNIAYQMLKFLTTAYLPRYRDNDAVIRETSKRIHLVPS